MESPTPSQARFLEQMITEFEALEINVKLNILGDFIIDLLFKTKEIFTKTHETKNNCKYFPPGI